MFSVDDQDFGIGTCGDEPDHRPAAVRGGPGRWRREHAGGCRRHALLPYLQPARHRCNVVRSRAANGAIHQLRPSRTGNANRPGKRAALGDGKQRERRLFQSRRNEQLQSNGEVRYRSARDQPVFCGISALRAFESPRGYDLSARLGNAAQRHKFSFGPESRFFFKFTLSGRRSSSPFRYSPFGMDQAPISFFCKNGPPG